MAAFEGLGKALRWLRARQDRRQYQVAEAAGVTKAMLSAYETEKQKPSLETLEKILEGLGVSLGDLQQALRIVKGEADALDPPPRPGTELAQPHAVDLYRILGIESPLPVEEEHALRQMMSGFLNYLRFMHFQVARHTDGGAGEGAAGGTERQPEARGAGAGPRPPASPQPSG